MNKWIFVTVLLFVVVIFASYFIFSNAGNIATPKTGQNGNNSAPTSISGTPAWNGVNSDSFKTALTHHKEYVDAYSQKLSQNMVGHESTVNYTVQIESPALIHATYVETYLKDYTWEAFGEIRPYFGGTPGNAYVALNYFPPYTTWTDMVKNLTYYDIAQNKDQIYSDAYSNTTPFFQAVNFQGGTIQKIDVSSSPSEDTFYQMAKNNADQANNLPEYSYTVSFDASYAVSGPSACLEFPINANSFTYAKITAPNKILNNTFLNASDCVKITPNVNGGIFSLSADFMQNASCPYFAIYEVCFN